MFLSPPPPTPPAPKLLLRALKSPVFDKLSITFDDNDEPSFNLRAADLVRDKSCQQ